MHMNQKADQDLSLVMIYVEGLFYRSRRVEIPFPSADCPLRILTGENGRGKTTIFKMLWSIFGGDDDFKQLAHTPFSAVTLLWSDTTELHFIRELAHDGLWATIRVALRRPEASVFTGDRYRDYLSGAHRLPNPERSIDTVANRAFRRAEAAETAGDISEDEALLLADENDRISLTREFGEEAQTPTARPEGGRRPAALKRAPSKNSDYVTPDERLPSEIEDFLARIDIDFVGTDRVISTQPEEPANRYYRASRTPRRREYESPIDDISSRILRLLLQSDAEPPDASDLVRILSSEMESDSHDVPALRMRIRELLARCEELIRFEIEVYKLQSNLEKLEHDLNDNAPERMRMALNFVLVETDRRIKELEQTKRRVEDFLQLINKLFCEKQIAMSYGNMVIVSDTGKTYPLSTLSSGEQHLIVLLGRILFPHEARWKSRRENTTRIVLLDEPEISLHIRWQYAVRDALRNLSSSGGYRVMVATHSLHILAGLEHFESDLSEEQ
jgi:energy-coupling factor transporter ATP-binding protein EcfA2